MLSFWTDKVFYFDAEDGFQFSVSQSDLEDLTDPDGESFIVRPIMKGMVLNQFIRAQMEIEAVLAKMKPPPRHA